MAESQQEKLFRTKVVPIMDKVRQDLAEKQAAELRKHGMSLSGVLASGIGPDGGMGTTDLNNFSLHYKGNWNSKNTEDYVKMVKKELQRQHITVDAAMEKKMIDKMVKDNIPKSSIDYIVRRAVTQTIFYYPQKMARTQLDEKIDKESEKRYSPTSIEKNTGNLLGAGLDYISSGIGMGSWKIAAGTIGLGTILSYFNDKMEDVPEVKVPENQKTVRFVPQWMLKQMGITNYATTSQKQLRIAHNWAKKNADNYEKQIAKMQSNNQQTYKTADGKTHTIEEAKIRLKEYRLFAQKTASALDMSQIKSELPLSLEKLKRASDSQLTEAMSFVNRKLEYYEKKYVDCVKNNRLTYKDADRKGVEHTYDEYDIRCRQYVLYAEKVQVELQRREAERQRKQAAEKPTVSYSTTSNEGASDNAATQSANGNEQTNTATPSNNPQGTGSSSTTTNWNNFLAEQGLSVSGGIWNNLGYIFAMLPDLIVGMFTGRNKNMTFKNNLLPLGMIMIGMFSKRNPLLKMIMMGFGGMMLFKNASKAIIGDATSQSSPRRNYKTYADEPLDGRIKDVAMKGNSMIATIDGLPMVVNIESSAAVDAYYKGKLPLNTLANAVLRKYDTQNDNLANAYEEEISKTEDEVRNIAIR